MRVISAAEVEQSWQDFNARDYSQIRETFSKNQPILWALLESQDRHLFGGADDHVRRYAVFIWCLLSTEARIRRIEGYDISKLIEEELEFHTPLVEESDFVAQQMLDQRSEAFPQNPLGAFVQREFSSEIAGLPDMPNSRLSWMWLLNCIVLFDRAAS